jgi:adenylate cyclase
MRRVFEDKQGNEIGQLDLWKYGYDARTRSWYRDTKTTHTLLVSSPYLAFSIGSPVITVSAPLQGKVNGVLAADLKLDSFSNFVQEQRPGQHGIVWIFDTVGSLLAHPDFAQFVNDALTHPSRSQLPNVDDISSGVAAAVLKSWPGGGTDPSGVASEPDRFASTVADSRPLTISCPPSTGVANA